MPILQINLKRIRDLHTVIWTTELPPHTEEWIREVLGTRADEILSEPSQLQAIIEFDVQRDGLQLCLEAVLNIPLGGPTDTVELSAPRWRQSGSIYEETWNHNAFGEGVDCALDHTPIRQNALFVLKPGEWLFGPENPRSRFEIEVE